MADNTLRNKYLLKNTANGTFQDVTTLFNGVRILTVDGMNQKGKTKNVYTEDWEYEQEEDFDIVMQDSSDTKQIIRENVDINVTFAVRQKYVRGNTTIDVRNLHDIFVDYMTNTDIWIKSLYTNKNVHCVCLNDYKPTMMKLHRGNSSFALGTITLHCLDKPSVN